VCRKCAGIIPAVEVRVGQLPVARLRRLAGRRPVSRSDVTGRRELTLALADAEAACRQLDEAVHRIAKQYHPMGCLPFVLAFATAVVVVGITARSLRWYWVALLALAATIGTWFTLSLLRFVSWSRNHPLLARLDRIELSRRRDEAAGDELLELGKAIVAKYLPEAESKSLLGRLDDAIERTTTLLGFDDDHVPERHAGA
jgi:hypothetical protein